MFPPPSPGHPRRRPFGRPGLGAAGGTRAANAEFLLAGAGGWVARAALSRPRLKVTWRTRAPREGGGGGSGEGEACPGGEAWANRERMGLGHKVTGQRRDVRCCQLALA